MISAELPVAQAQQPQTYIGPEETTTLNNVLKKVALFGIILGSGLLLASFFTGIPLIVGAAVTALSSYALHYLSNIDSSHGLIEAAKEGNRCMLKFLLLLGANPNIIQQNVTPQRSALLMAACQGHSGIVKDLLNAGGDPNIMDSFQRTPLSEAVAANQDEVVEILLEHCADPAIRTRNLEPAVNSFEYANREQELYQQDRGDHALGGDERTRKERKAAADRIVELLRPYREFAR